MSHTDRSESSERHTFLLSVWCERAGGSWRAALRPADGGPRVGFGDLEQLVAFLLRLQEALTPATPAAGGISGQRETRAERVPPTG